MYLVSVEMYFLKVLHQPIFCCLFVLLVFIHVSDICNTGCTYIEVGEGIFHFGPLLILETVHGLNTVNHKGKAGCVTE